MSMTALEYIKKISLIHCARGPAICEKCKLLAKKVKICLLKLYPEPTYIARPTLTLTIDGKPSHYEYDIRKVFKDEDEAREYSKKYSIPIEF